MEWIHQITREEKMYLLKTSNKRSHSKRCMRTNNIRENHFKCSKKSEIGIKKDYIQSNTAFLDFCFFFSLALDIQHLTNQNSYIIWLIERWKIIVLIIHIHDRQRFYN